MVGSVVCVRSPFGRSVSTLLKNDKRNKSSATPPCEETWKKQIQECFITDPKYFWVESSPCSKQMRTWHDVEEQYYCSILSRCSRKSAPLRKMLYHSDDGGIEICKRGCLQPCGTFFGIPVPPCETLDYPTGRQLIMDSFKRLLAITLFLGLIYVTHKWHVWESTTDTLSTFLKDPDEKIERFGHALVNSVSNKWNKTVDVLFGLVKTLLSGKDDRSEEFNQCDFIVAVQEGVRAEKEMFRQKQHEVKCGLSLADEHVYQQWELVYNYEPKNIAPEDVECESNWKWMGHHEEGYVEKMSPVTPYESSAKDLVRSKKENATLASIYTDECTEWSVNPCDIKDDDIVNECADSKSIGCKRRNERKRKTTIDPSRCSCPLSANECTDNTDVGNV